MTEVATHPFKGFSKQGMPWFQQLAHEQNREWFQANREVYETVWLSPMKALISELSAPIAKTFGRKVGPPKVFRLNRDVRFSKDKSPYKTSISAVIPFVESPGGEGTAALYVQLGLECTVGFGFYMLEPATLLRLRKLVLDEKQGPVLQKLVSAAQKAGLSFGGMAPLKRGPPGVDPKHPRIELLKQKGLALSTHEIPSKVLFSAGLKPWLLEQAKHAAPVVKWGFTQKLNA